MFLGGEIMAIRLSFASDRSPQARGIDRQKALLGKRVLVVDDSASQRHKLAELYQSIGLQVVGEASNGLECLALAEKLQPDIISLDVIMPIMHGVETLGYLRSKKSAAIIIYVSALGGVESLSEVKSPGGHLPDAIFSKKDGRETFVEVLTAVLAGEPEPLATAGGEVDEVLTVASDRVG